MASMGAVNRRSVLFTILIVVLCALTAGVAWFTRGTSDRALQRDLPHDEARTVPAPQMNTPSEPVARTSVDDSASEPVHPPPAVTSESTGDEWRQARLEELERMYSSIVQLGPDSTIGDPMELNMFFWLTIAPQMDARGEYQELVPFAKTKIERRPNENVFTFRQRVYHVPVGLYPEFDAFVAFMEKAGRTHTAVPDPNARPPAFHVDQAYLEQLAVMMRDAQAVIRKRTDPY